MHPREDVAGSLLLPFPAVMLLICLRSPLLPPYNQSFYTTFFCMVCKCVHHHFVNYHIPSLLCSCEVSPEVLHPVLRCRVQKGHVATGVDPEEGLKNGKRAGTPLLRRKVESAGVVQPGEEEAPGRPDCSLSILKGSL